MLAPVSALLFPVPFAFLDAIFAFDFVSSACLDSEILRRAEEAELRVRLHCGGCDALLKALHLGEAEYGGSCCTYR